MELRCLKLNFGVLQGDYAFSPGLNLILEDNEAGKSTLSRIICGFEGATGGERRVSSRLQIAVFSHDLVRALDPASSVIDEVLKDTLPEVRQKIRNYLGLFLFSGDDVSKKVSVSARGEGDDAESVREAPSHLQRLPADGTCGAEKSKSFHR